MDADIFKEWAMWATAGGGGLFLAARLIHRISSGIRAAVAADDKSISILDRMERQLAEQEARFHAAEDRWMAQARRLEQRADEASAQAGRVERERDDALAQVERLAFVIRMLREDAR